MPIESLQNLPPEVKEVVFSTELSDYNQQLADRFSLNRNQLDFILDLEEKLFLQKISSLDLPNELENMERAQYYDLREICLEIAYKILWPLQDYLKDVDRLILRLGGKVPHLKHLHKRTMQNPTLPNYISGTVKQLLKQYPDFKDLRLSSKKIIDREGNLLSPTVDNWLNDYFKQMGAGYHSSLQRAKYLSSDRNILDLTEEEKGSIRNFFISYDDDSPIEIDNSDVIVKVRELPEKTVVGKEKSEQPKTEEILEQINQRLVVWQKKIVGEDLILSEAGGSLHKLRDVLWQAVGIQDQDKTLACLKLLIEKKALDLMLQEDKRFQGIMRRFISVRFGEKLSLVEITDKLIRRRLFFELILNDKLRLPQAEAALLGFYLSNIQGGEGQVVYLDLTDNTLKWREISNINNQLAWVQPVN